jgi:signal transduction histidine kinase
MTKPGDPSYERLRLIFEASEKASSLTNQLLTFSKSKSIFSINFNPNTLINKVGIFLSRILGEKIKLNLLLNPDVACINASPDQIEQVILNLAINSRDAMPEGGSLTISTENVEFKESEIKLKPWVKPGKYVLIKVSDTGKGIPEEIIDRIFEPFFSTKEKGSGLGLSIVYGIVRQSGGHINVESKLGEGTTFRIFIPASEEKTDYLIKPESREKMFKKRGARILVIEDDPNVLEFIKDVLESSGYEVVTASTGEEGIEIAREERIGSTYN